jgi:hypothetical protein
MPELPCSYRGKRIETMSREELIEALKTVAHLYHQQIDSSIAAIQTLRALSKRP